MSKYTISEKEIQWIKAHLAMDVTVRKDLENILILETKKSYLLKVTAS